MWLWDWLLKKRAGAGDGSNWGAALDRPTAESTPDGVQPDADADADGGDSADGGGDDVDFDFD